MWINGPQISSRYYKSFSQKYLEVYRSLLTIYLQIKMNEYCKAFILTHCRKTWFFFWQMKATRNKKRIKCICCCSGCLCTAMWKYDCIRMKLISVSFPFCQIDILLELTNILTSPFSFLLPMYYLKQLINYATSDQMSLKHENVCLEETMFY